MEIRSSKKKKLGLGFGVISETGFEVGVYLNVEQQVFKNFVGAYRRVIICPFDISLVRAWLAPESAKMRPRSGSRVMARICICMHAADALLAYLEFGSRSTN